MTSLFKASLRQIRGTLQLPGDKSISHRALLFNALSGGSARLDGLSNGADVKSTQACLEALGVQFKSDASALYLKAPKRLSAPTGPLDCGNSGTTTRLLCGLLAGSGFEVRLIGDESLSKRPMRRVLEPLSQMGARFLASDNRLPLTILPKQDSLSLNGIDYMLPMASAQVKSAILLAGLWTPSESVVSVREALPTRDHTERMLNAMGCSVVSQPFEASGVQLQLKGRLQDIQPTDCCIPGDLSSAAFWMVATALLPGSELTLTDVSLNPTRSPMLPLLASLGVEVESVVESESCGEPLGRVTLRAPDYLKGDITLAPDAIPLLIDELPILTILGLFLEGRFCIEGAEELRHKESDRLKAMADIVRACGFNVVETQDGLSFEGNPDWEKEAPESLYAHPFETHHDHRLVMSLDILSLKTKQPLHILGKDWVAVSYPSFYRDMDRLLAP
jgi:3-phosphoshikimate 1-carboxyvinyltransferase